MRLKFAKLFPENQKLSEDCLPLKIVKSGMFSQSVLVLNAGVTTPAFTL